MFLNLYIYTNSPKGDEQCHSIFIDSKGHPYAYSGDEKAIFTFSGKSIADDSTYSFSGKHLGFFEGGQIWDHSGSVRDLCKKAKIQHVTKFAEIF